MRRLFCDGLIRATLLVAGVLCTPGPISAQDPVHEYPAKPVRVVVPYPPGGAVDIQTRLFSQKLSETLGRPFVVDNRAGAAGTIASALVAQAAPDGYTLLAVPSDFAITPALYKNLGFDPIGDFAPISLLTEAPFLLAVHPSVAVHSTKDLIELARSRPGILNFASGGQGTSLHLALELFKLMAKVNIVHVTYKGGGPAVAGTVAAEVNGIFSNIIASISFAKSGKLRALAVTSAQRSSTFPDLPTVSESGLPGYVTTSWSGWLAPRGTPVRILNRMSSELEKMVKSRDIAGRIVADGATPVGSSPEKFRQLVAVEIQKFQTVVTAGGLRIE